MSGHPSFSARHLRRCSRSACGARVWLTVTVAGRYQLVDERPTVEGNRAVAQDRHGVLRSRTITEAEPRSGAEWRMMPHAATCKGDRPVQVALPVAARALPENVIVFDPGRRRRRP